MRVAAALLIVSALVTPARPAHAADRPKPRRVYHVSLAWDAPVIGVAAAGIVVPYAFGASWIDESCPPCTKSDVNWIDRTTVGWHSHAAHVAGDVLIVADGVAAIVVDALDVRDARETAVDLVVIGEATLVTGALTTAAKYATSRPLPAVVNNQDPALARRSAGYRAFWSGHAAIGATLAVSLAETMRLRHEAASRWILAGGLAVTAGASALKLAAGEHYLTDVVVGAIVGAGVGWLIPRLHRVAPEVHVAADSRSVSLIVSF